MVRRKLLRSAVSLLTVMTMVLGGTLTAYAGSNVGETQQDVQGYKNTVDLNGNSDGLTVTVEQGNTVTVNILTEADQVANGESSSENGNAGSGTSSDEQTALANEIKSTIGDLGGRVSKLSTTNPTELGGKDGVTHIEERLKTWTKYNSVDKETVLEWLDKLKQVGIKTPEYTDTYFPGNPGTYEVESSSNLVTADLLNETVSNDCDCPDPDNTGNCDYPWIHKTETVGDALPSKTDGNWTYVDDSGWDNVPQILEDMDNLPTNWLSPSWTSRQIAVPQSDSDWDATKAVIDYINSDSGSDGGSSDGTVPVTTYIQKVLMYKDGNVRTCVKKLNKYVYNLYRIEDGERHLLESFYLDRTDVNGKLDEIPEPSFEVGNGKYELERMQVWVEGYEDLYYWEYRVYNYLSQTKTLLSVEVFDTCDNKEADPTQTDLITMESQNNIPEALALAGEKTDPFDGSHTAYGTTTLHDVSEVYVPDTTYNTTNHTNYITFYVKDGIYQGYNLFYTEQIG